MIKFTYLCNGTREDHRYCEKGDEEGIVAGWNRLGKRTGHSYEITKVEDFEQPRGFSLVRLASSKEFVHEKW